MDFPAPEYAETVLAVNFADAQRYYLDALFDIHYAHTLMLARQGIITCEVARRCLAGLDSLNRVAIASARFDGRCEDLFFHIEAALERACGPENAGQMHTARSRNDIAIAQYRMRLRREILNMLTALNAARRTLLEISRKHLSTLLPAYTHTQPAQPTTLAHYFMAAVELFGRDERRLQAAFATVNRCPLGACAITTTGFPIDRHFTAGILGFDGLQLNSYGAIAATDYITETAGVVATAMVNLGKITQDLLLWCTAEFGLLRLSDAWVQSSSIMPQKRNPVPLEHTRVLASKALGQAQGVFAVTHNTPFGDINDSEDDLQPLVFSMTHDATRALRLFAGIMADCEFNTERMSARAHSDFLTVTELADTLVRSERWSFREAHRVVSVAVRNLQGVYSAPAMVDQIFALAPGLKTPRALLFEALDPAHFVAIRTIPGGPGLEAIQPAIDAAGSEVDAVERWLAEKIQLVDSIPRRVAEVRASV